jgi:hypothetical protein
MQTGIDMNGVTGHARPPLALLRVLQISVTALLMPPMSRPLRDRAP